MTGAKILWKPSPSFLEQSNLFRYRRWLKKKKGLFFESYEDLWRWSCDNLEEFWTSITEFFNVDFKSNFNTILEHGMPPDSIWFDGGTLNYTQHLFRHEDSLATAIISIDESKTINRISWKSLRNAVSTFQSLLIDLGIKKGDRVVAVMPNCAEATIAFMATSGLGAIWSCCSPDFGADTIRDRFSQIEPDILIAADGYQYNHKEYHRISLIEDLRTTLPNLRHTILLPYLDPDAQMTGTILWPENDPNAEKILFEELDFAHPLWVLYSSGTTGKPKAITHSHGGMLLEHLKYLALQNDVQPGEHFFWFSTTGWMMWNFLQASMLVGAVPILYDGSPGIDNLQVLWHLAEKLPIHHFGTSAPYLTALMKRNPELGNAYDLGALRSIGSTGSPLPSEVFEWIYSNVKSDVWLCSMSGGTDVCTAFVGGCPEKPVYSGRIQCRALGCQLKSYDETGQEAINALGEMVIESPMPCMPVYFWNDPDNTRYRASYFERFEDKWRHGDFVKIFEDGSLVIEGRSDATLNRKGVRIGTAEIYDVLQDLPTVVDSLIISIEQRDGSDLMPLFVVLEGDLQLDDDLQDTIKNKLKTNCSPRHVPDIITQVSEIPYTLSGKKMEVPVKRIFLDPVYFNSIDLGAIRNPQAMLALLKIAQAGLSND